MEFKITTLDGLGGHDDLLLFVPSMELEICTDTYYLALALENATAKKDIRSVNDVIVSLLNYWQENVEKTNINSVIYLPFEFYDQGIGCFEVRCLAGEALVSYGFTTIEGWSVSPLKLGSFCNDVPDFRKSSETTISVSSGDIVLAIQNSIGQIQSQQR